MAALTADALLAGPRGRGLCMVIAEWLYGEEWPAWYADHLGGLNIVIDALGSVDPTPVYEWRDPLRFVEPMEVSVSSAMYWQEPHEEDAVAADPGVIAALGPVAAAVVSSPAAAWWSTPVDLAGLRYTSRYDEEHPPSPPELAGARDRLQRWHAEVRAEERRAARERPADPSAPLSGCWWSTPTMRSLVTTTRPLPGLGSIELVWEEDSFGQHDAAIWPLTTTQAPRVWEIDGPQAWVRLVDRYPLEVTYARRHDWYRTTGRVGSWCIPDWNAVAADCDAVHLSLAGYLTTATRALPLTDGEAATVLAGWNPDQTWWLNDVLTTTTACPEWWHNPDEADAPDFAWHRVSR